jgi:hypothetical protein
VRTLAKRASLLLGLLAGGPVLADPVADFYRGKQVPFIISTAAGGDYDQWSRVIIRHLSKHVPGNPVFIPRTCRGPAS